MESVQRQLHFPTASNVNCGCANMSRTGISCIWHAFLLPALHACYSLPFSLVSRPPIEQPCRHQGWLSGGQNRFAKHYLEYADPPLSAALAHKSCNKRYRRQHKCLSDTKVGCPLPKPVATARSQHACIQLDRRCDLFSFFFLFFFFLSPFYFNIDSVCACICVIIESST